MISVSQQTNSCHVPFTKRGFTLHIKIENLVQSLQRLNKLLLYNIRAQLVMTPVVLVITKGRLFPTSSPWVPEGATSGLSKS